MATKPQVSASGDWGDEPVKNTSLAKNTSSLEMLAQQVIPIMLCNSTGLNHLREQADGSIEQVLKVGLHIQTGTYFDYKAVEHKLSRVTVEHEGNNAIKDYWFIDKIDECFLLVGNIDPLVIQQIKYTKAASSIMAGMGIGYNRLDEKEGDKFKTEVYIYIYVPKWKSIFRVGGTGKNAAAWLDNIKVLAETQGKQVFEIPVSLKFGASFTCSPQITQEELNKLKKGEAVTSTKSKKLSLVDVKATGVEVGDETKNEVLSLLPLALTKIKASMPHVVCTVSFAIKDGDLTPTSVVVKESQRDYTKIIISAGEVWSAFVEGSDQVYWFENTFTNSEGKVESHTTRTKGASGISADGVSYGLTFLDNDELPEYLAAKKVADWKNFRAMARQRMEPKMDIIAYGDFKRHPVSGDIIGIYVAAMDVLAKPGK